MGLQIWCPPDEVYIEELVVKGQMSFFARDGNVYSLGKIEESGQNTMEKWGKFIQIQIPKVKKPDKSNTTHESGTNDDLLRHGKFQFRLDRRLCNKVSPSQGNNV